MRLTTTPDMAAENEASISGLRSQIKANALILFPSAATWHGEKQAYSKTPSTDAFEIVVTASPAWQAALMYHSGTGRTRFHRAAEGQRAGDAVQALRNLLATVSEALAARPDVGFGSERSESLKEYARGMVDEEMAKGEGWIAEESEEEGIDDR